MPSFSRALVGFIALLAVFTVACSPTPAPDELLARASQSLEAGNLTAVVIDAKAALQQDPENAEGRYLLAEAYYRQRQLQAALVEFKHSLAARPDPAVAARYAEALIASGEWQRLIEMRQGGDFEFALANGDFMATLARAQALSGDTFTAEHSLAVARKLTNSSPALLLAEAVFTMHHTGDLAQTTAALDELTGRYPDYEEGWSFLGAVALTRGELELAETAFGRAVELNQSRTSDRLSLIKLLLDRGATELAAEMLRPAATAAPRHPGVLYAQARLLLTQNQPRAALEALQQVLAVDPSHYPSLYLAGVANVREGNFATAQLHLSKFLSGRPHHVNARLLQANVNLQLGETSLAREMARSILKEHAENMPARQILAASEREESPGAGPLQEARGALQRDERVAAREHFSHALELDPLLAPARQGLTALAIGDGDFGAALASVKEGLHLQPDNLQGLLDLAAVHANAGDLEEMAETLRNAVNTHPEAAEPRLVLARYHVQQGEPEAAVSLLRTLPDHPRVLVLLAQIEQSRNDPLAAEGFLRRALELDPENDEARKLLVASLLLQGKVQLAEELQAFWLAELPDNIATLHQMAALYLARGWIESARIVYERLYTLAPDDVVALNNLAWIQRDDNPGRALELVERALQAAPGHAGVLDTKAMVLFYQGRLDRALEVNQQSLDATPAKPVYRLHRARILVATGDRNTARDILGQLLSEHSYFEERADAEVLLREIGEDTPGQ
ncbi:tetratricopeptide repeat protein [Haliea sp. E1-2-M8]|uniref:tetratricopeptide repeat protein n=1 Tax=Haliea sp. E1-2-M8 TaxID=3064706 RepID=UPI002725359C|nr:tetratricopeptide repeat protein [Haliea sp. E1-2-M8]MDO8863766.1 tetratricopeptide repeat protein [Haliea sp. E1-2-M8]